MTEAVLRASKVLLTVAIVVTISCGGDDSADQQGGVNAAAGTAGSGGSGASGASGPNVDISAGGAQTSGGSGPTGPTITGSHSSP
jgi:hypothetical protein